MKRLYGFIIIVLAMAVTACSSDDNDTSGAAPQPSLAESYVESGLLVQTTDSIFDAPDAFISRIGSEPFFNYVKQSLAPTTGTRPVVESLLQLRYNIDVPALDALFTKELGKNQSLQRQWQIESYVFEYKTKSAKGEDVVLSGRVTFPNNKAKGVGHEVETLSLSAHQYLLNPVWAPSLTLGLMPLRAFMNSAVIEPDFQGVGNTFQKMVYCAFSSEVLAQQEADCTRAALDVMHRHGVHLSAEGHSTSWGCSLAAPVPVALAKWYDTEAPQEFRDLVRLTSTFSGEGVFDYASFLEWLGTAPDFDATTASGVIPLIAAYTQEQLSGYKPTDLLADWVTTTQVSAGGAKMTYYQAAIMSLSLVAKGEDIPSLQKLSTILAPDMLAGDSTMDMYAPKTQALMKALRFQANTFDWTPVRPLFLACCKKDEAISYNIAKDNYQALSGNGTNPNVHWTDVPLALDGQEIMGLSTGNHLLASVLMMTYMASVKEPADMANLYLHQAKY